MRKNRIRHEQGLFLSLLPFPGQWQWLIDAENNPGGNREIKELFMMKKKGSWQSLRKSARKHLESAIFARF